MAFHHVTSTESIECMLRQNFKLSIYEARAFLSLLRQGKQNPKQLSSMAEIPLPRVFDTLESFMTKGSCSSKMIPTHRYLQDKLSEEDLHNSTSSSRIEIRRSDHILFDMTITDQDGVIIGVPDPLSEKIN